MHLSWGSRAWNGISWPVDHVFLRVPVRVQRPAHPERFSSPPSFLGLWPLWALHCPARHLQHPPARPLLPLLAAGGGAVHLAYGKLSRFPGVGCPPGELGKAHKRLSVGEKSPKRVLIWGGVSSPHCSLEPGPLSQRSPTLRTSRTTGWGPLPKLYSCGPRWQCWCHGLWAPHSGCSSVAP